MPLSREARVAEARERARSLVGRIPGLAASPPPRLPSIDAAAGSHAGALARFGVAAAVDPSGDGEEAGCRRLIGELASSGLLRHLVPAAFGGLGATVEVGIIAAVREELAYASGLLDLLFVMQGLGSFPITHAGTEEQRARFLPGIVSGGSVAAFAVTEPEAGSDVGSIQTSARPDAGDYVLDGTKTFISNAPFADLITVIARTDAGTGKKGLTAFVVERGMRGLEARADIELIAPHPIGSLAFRGCRVPGSHRLGEEGDGYRIAMATLDRFRVTVGAAATGLAARALDEAVRFAKGRVQFGQPISEFEGIQFKLAEMATRLEAARLLVERAADSADGTRGAGAPPLSPLGEDPAREAAMAKLFATEAAQEIVDEAVQIHGGRGLLRGSIVESLYREVRALRIYEGTSEIQRTVIARSLLGR